MSDLINRQDAIDAVMALPNCENGYSDTYDKAYIIGVLEELPSAQPEIIMCKDCKNWDTTWHNEWLKNHHYCAIIDGSRHANWYCADAERREE